MSHTYTAHVTFLADSDEQALRLGALINKITGGGTPVSYVHEPLLTTTALHISDADDYAEVIDLDLLCGTCGAPAEDRLRVGNGSRQCRKCADAYAHGVYAIMDTDI